ncbi:hypothetical protein L249_4382 [Ophiocordyceps polyrhachis-furcata BCC 54312]|uniref:MYND-type domain-containing protein n=1 Tax=Ophiocordyceps polyrhachis-furcata BCC 54312 TaxID=1330021 RepID=A0A367L7I3_9HYPO|nr:hypothetical protein L249_4382 [Ophiocordyceps polyrhachis-furcata BCC 54312]
MADICSLYVLFHTIFLSLDGPISVPNQRTDSEQLPVLERTRSHASSASIFVCPVRSSSPFISSALKKKRGDKQIKTLAAEEKTIGKKGTMEIANLRDNKAFPDLINLPYQHVVDFTYWTSTDGFVFDPRKHWCFLGEVVVETFSKRLRILVRDRSGALAPVDFQTSELGVGLVSRGEMRVGATVAILYAEKYVFGDSNVGIRQLSLETVKVFPVSMDGLMQVNDRLQEYAAVKDGQRMCHNCERKATTMFRCGKCNLFYYCNKCNLFYYCNKECQIAAWIDKGHKHDCKILQDSELRGLLFMDWDRFETYHQFSTPLA